MKALLTLSFLTISILAASSLSSQAQDWSPKMPFITKSFTGESIAEVRAETSGGNLSVEGTDGEIRVEVYIWPSNNRDKGLSKEELQKKLDEEYDLTLSVSDHVLTAMAKPKDHFLHWNRSLGISFKVFAPHNVSSELRTSGGNISLSGLQGAKQDFRTSGGNLRVDRINGEVTGKTSGGNIEISNVNPDTKNAIDLSTSGGNITASNCKGGTIRVSTSGGNLSLRNLEGAVTAGTSGGSVSAELVNGDLSAHTSGGNVHLSGLSGSLETSTSGGSIDVSMTGMGKYVRIHNSGGNISLEIPKGQGVELNIHGDRVSADFASSPFTGKIDKKRVEGTLNGGGIPVTVDGGGGGVQLTLR
jgi:hypothetical protein